VCPHNDLGVSPALEFSGIVTNGKLPREVSERIASTIRRMEGKRLLIVIKEQKRQRSNKQNRYYFGVIVMMVTEMFREAGNYVGAEEVHDFLKEHVGNLRQIIVTPDGEVLKILGSTTKLSTQEFEVYMEKVRAWAAGFGLIIPLPHEEVQ
jgi:hypothetical protein